MRALKLKVILGSTRAGRFGDRPAHWIDGEASRLSGVAAELRDLQDFPLPILDRVTSPSREGGGLPERRRHSMGGEDRGGRRVRRRGAGVQPRLLGGASRTRSITSSRSGRASRSAS